MILFRFVQSVYGSWCCQLVTTSAFAARLIIFSDNLLRVFRTSRQKSGQLSMTYSPAKAGRTKLQTARANLRSLNTAIGPEFSSILLRKTRLDRRSWRGPSGYSTKILRQAGLKFSGRTSTSP